MRLLVATLLFGSLVRADPFPGYDDLRARAAPLWKEAPDPPVAYVVLLPEGSPLAPAARVLADYRHAEIVPFCPQRPEDVLPALIRKGARYVAIFVEPKEMDVNLLRRFVVLSTLADEDPFCDFAFGFFTGASPGKAKGLVERSVRADRGGVKPVALQWNVSNISQRYEGTSFLDGIPGDSYYVKTGDLDYARKALAELGHAGFIHIGGCADPEGIWLFDDHRNLEPDKHWPFDPKKVGDDPKGEMPRVTAADFRALKLDGAIVWTHACHIGSVGRVWVEGDIVSTFGATDRIEEYSIPPGRSVALAILGAGASAYIAPLGPNFGMQANAEEQIASETGVPLGDVLRRGYHDVVMDTEGHPERIGLYVTGKAARWDPDDFVNYNGPHNRALYGDPLLSPFARRKSPATVEIAVIDGGFSFRVTKSGYHGRTWYGNRGADPGRGRIYEVIPIRTAGTKATVGAVKARTADGKELPILRTTALLERIDGGTFLHLQIVTSDAEALRAAGATVEVSVKAE